MMSEERIEWHLWNWQQSHYRSREQGEGFPSSAGHGMIENYTSDGDSEKRWDAQCAHWAWITGLVIDDLEISHGTPIYKRAIFAQLLEGQWELPDIALGPTFRYAVPLVGRGLDRRGIE